MMKLKAALLGCALLAATAAAQEQSYFDTEDPFAIDHGSALLNRDFRSTCEAIAKNILPASEVFYPGGVLILCRPPFSKLVVVSCQARHNSRRISPTGPTPALR